MSVEENKRVARLFVEQALNKQDLELAREIMTPDKVTHMPGVPTLPSYDAWAQMCQVFFTAFPDMHITITDVIAEDDRVAGRFTFSGTHRGEFNGIPPTNRSFSVEGVDIYRFEGGKIAEAWSSFDSLGMLQQLGVIPTPESSHA